LINFIINQKKAKKTIRNLGKGHVIRLRKQSSQQGYKGQKNNGRGQSPGKRITDGKTSKFGGTAKNLRANVAVGEKIQGCLKRNGQKEVKVFGGCGVNGAT